MYRHILLPADGSALSRKAVRSGILFAKEAGARVTAIHVMPAPSMDELEAWTHHEPGYADKHARLFQKFAEAALQFVADTAASEGVPCSVRLVSGAEPYRAIVDAAQAAHCDLVFMASHGAGGDTARLPGSETLKVLIHSKVPVLVHKPAAAAP
jgi:nucleotide-binding universal stress UspA family protein